MKQYPIRSTCEKYRPAVEAVWGEELTPLALFIADKESIGCTANKSLKPNFNGTEDWCIFAINNEPDTAKNLTHCIKRGYEKYMEGRKGVKNASAFYAVCTPGDKPEPKYQGIKCNS